ncbi:MAG: hypothetical protein AB1775_09740 [Bacteroidota bacterium]
MNTNNIKYVLFFLLFMLSATSFCGPLRFAPQKLVQPNGDTVKCFASGDEYYHWLHDKDGYTITLNTVTKYWVYADKKGDDLVATNLIVGKSDPKKAKLKKWLLPSWDKIKERYNRVQKFRNK